MAEPKEKTFGTTEPKPDQKTLKAKSSYPASDDAKQAFEAQDETYEDTPIGRAYCRLYDHGINLGPAMGKPYQVDDGYERQYFLYGRAAHALDEGNVNMTVQFYDARGLVGEESGI